MEFPLPIIEGTLLQRYKRFLADVKLSSGQTITAHCMNTGSMKTCIEAGSPVLLSDHGPDTSRKLRYTFEAIRIGEHWIGVNTANPNRIVAEAISAGHIPELGGYVMLQREVKYGTNSRIDILLSSNPRYPDKKCYVEVKNTTMREGTGALFPDAVSERALKHVLELAKVVKSGHRGAIVFLVNRTDCEWMGAAAEIDPDYAKALKKAVTKSGVEAYAYRARTTPLGTAIDQRLPVRL
jgi:sugar fermentation stimulation protein A